MYIIPQTQELLPEIGQMISRARAHYITAAKARDVILPTNDDAIAIASVSTTSLSTIVRNMDELFDELPIVVTGFPGVPYPPEWIVISASIPAIQYSELEVRLLKAPNIGISTDDATRLAQGVVPERDLTASAAQQPASYTIEESVETDDDNYSGI